MSRAWLLAAPVTSSGHGHASGVFQIIFGIVFGLIGLLHAINPRLFWRMSRWQFKNPEANEPSAAAFTLQRVLGVVFFGIGIALVVWGISRT